MAGLERGALRPLGAQGGIRDAATARHVGVGETPLASAPATPGRGSGLRFLVQGDEPERAFPRSKAQCHGRGMCSCAVCPGMSLLEREDMDNRKDEKSRTLCATSEEGLKARGKEKRKRKRSRSRSSSVSSTSSSSSTSTSSSSSRSSSRSSSSSSSRDSPKSKSKKKKKEKHNKKKRKKENKMKKKKEKKKRKEKTGPVQLSKFFKNKKKNENYSMITGKKIKMKIKKTKEDIERDRNRAQLLEFLNSAL
ncbi:pre-mRNA-splicing factor CWC22 homolog [Onychostruthus taczanowskii]|uniref:pre-mRNA-splicing factor CWC22 homolog n=1 Tax=Onychostruthus taczanowskii TaxID=356909 RepID=UPI001B806F51|nr:pre-mRNA-splicing factor CWC22 homolog [Onychostruthus taczanowskii]